MTVTWYCWITSVSARRAEVSGRIVSAASATMPRRRSIHSPTGTPRRGMRAVLHEMRPARSTAAHQTGRLAELVCSNSLKSESEGTAPWLLKEELRRSNSLLLQAAQKARVPGGHALTVDRERFAEEV